MSSPSDWPELGTPLRSSPSHSPSTQSRPASSTSNWSQPGSFYLSGSSAPTLVHQYRSSRHPPPPPRPTQSPRASGSSSPAGSFAGSLTGRDKNGAAILMTEAVCCCCGTGLRYPRDSSSYRCGVCLVVGEGRAKEYLRHDANPDFVSAEEVDRLAELLSRRRRPPPLSPATEPISHDTLTLDSATFTNGDTPDSSTPQEDDDDDDDAESLLLAALSTAYTSLSSLSASFRHSAPPARLRPDTTPLISFDTLSTFYNLVESRPRAMQLLRERTAALLERPGREGVGPSGGGDGAWAVAMLESPLFDRSGTPSNEERQQLLSRFIGLVSNLDNVAHHTLVTYLSAAEYPKARFQLHVERVVAFVSLRIGLSAFDSSSSAAASYSSDWGVKAGARVGALLAAANQQTPRLDSSAFYSTMCDSLGLAAMVDAFRAWELGESRFSIVQYPFLLSLGIKVALLAVDGQRQMEEQARIAMRSTLYTRQLVQPVLPLKVRRAQLVGDSFRAISHHRDELKKSLRITFEGEDGVDAGGLRKEWFLLLCRQLFDPQFGQFLQPDSDSGLTYFNPSCIDDPDDYYLVGAVLGLAIYNSVTLDVPLPQVVYKKLRDEAVGLKDLEAWQPELAKGFRALLEFEPKEEVEDVFCRSFVAEFESWGELETVELVPGGAEVAVTGENREEYVKLMVDFLLNTHVAAQFEPFAEGFLDVVGGNALSLIRGEELELLVRGSPEPLEIEILKQSTVYEGFPLEDKDPTVRAFWRVFAGFDARRQRELLRFVTGSDRIPATGTSGLQLKLTNAGKDETGRRFPTSHTCFDQLVLYEVGEGGAGEEELKEKLVRAMEESEGFGLR